MTQPVPREAIAVLTEHGIRLSRTDAAPAPARAPGSLKQRLKAEAVVFGTLQILCGAVLLGLGIILAAVPAAPYFTAELSTLLNSAYPFVGSLCFIVCGSLSVFTEKRSAKPLVNGCLACSFLGTVLALAGVALLSYTLAAVDSAFQQCELSRLSSPTTASYPYHHREDRSDDCFRVSAALLGTVALMLVCSALELCLAVLTAVLWWRQACSDFPGTVHFQPQGHGTDLSPGYEELIAS